MTDSWLGKPAPFKEVYPKIKSIRITVHQHGDMNRPAQAEQLYTVNNIPRDIPCVNPRCQQGGYDIQPTLDWLSQARETSYKVDWSCNGHEGTPKGRPRGDPCMNYVDMEFQITHDDG